MSLSIFFTRFLHLIMLVKLSRPFTIEEVNQWSPADFQERFKNVVECWPEASVFASMLLPFRNVDNLILAFHHYLDQLPAESE